MERVDEAKQYTLELINSIKERSSMFGEETNENS